MKTEDMPLLELSGTPYERGCRHGESCADSIDTLLQRLDAELESILFVDGAPANVRPASFVRQFLDDTDFEPAIRQWTPGLMDEVRGIADGARQPLEQVLVLNLIDELWAYAARQAPSPDSEACTCFGVVGPRGQPTWSGQNMDVGAWLEGHQVLLRIRPPGPAPDALVFSFAGCIGLNGMNAAPMGMCCNTLLNLRASRSGLPVLFVLRRFLELSRLADGIEFLRSVPHASGQNYLVSAPGEVRSFECSADRVEEYASDPEHRRVCHTNHPLANTDIEPDSKTVSGPSTHARMASISARLADPGRPVDLDAIKAALSAHDDPQYPVSRANSRNDRLIGFTLGSSIYEYADPPRLHLATGPPCSTAWSSFDF